MLHLYKHYIMTFILWLNLLVSVFHIFKVGILVPLLLSHPLLSANHHKTSQLINYSLIYFSFSFRCHPYTRCIPDIFYQYTCQPKPLSKMTHPFVPFIYPFIQLSIHPFIHPSIYPSIHSYIQLSLCHRLYF